MVADKCERTGCGRDSAGEAVFYVAAQGFNPIPGTPFTLALRTGVAVCRIEHADPEHFFTDEGKERVLIGLRTAVGPSALPLDWDNVLVSVE